MSLSGDLEVRGLPDAESGMVVNLVELDAFWARVVTELQQGSSTFKTFGQVLEVLEGRARAFANGHGLEFIEVTLQIFPERKKWVKSLSLPKDRFVFEFSFDGQIDIQDFESHDFEAHRRVQFGNLVVRIPQEVLESYEAKSSFQQLTGPSAEFAKVLQAAFPEALSIKWTERISQEVVYLSKSDEAS